MRVFILGNGAREHALTWAFSRSRCISALFVAPGNAGTAEIAVNLPDVQPTKAQEVIQTCRKHKIDLVFVGPEGPLSVGIVDALQKENIPVIGPPLKSAQLESSKAFSKSFMVKHGIPTAEHQTFTSFSAIEKYLTANRKKIVLKKSGLAAGKGVLESQDRGEQLSFARKVLKDDSLVVEEYLEGFETSIFALSDGSTFLVLPPCMDYKKALDGNQGPNTGGMGSICPVPQLTASMMETIHTEVVTPTFKGLQKEGLLYQGILYFGLMITREGPKVLEYNVRLGDPETQVLLPLIQNDMGNLAEAITTGALDKFPLSYSGKSTVGVVIAAKGYPETYQKGWEVKIDPSESGSDSLIFHAATFRDSAGTLRTNGGRCFTVVGIGKDIFEASARAYAAVPSVRFNGAWYRKDIGKLLPDLI